MRTRPLAAILVLLFSTLLAAQAARAEDGSAAWLRYQRLSVAPVQPNAIQPGTPLPGILLALGGSPVITAARDELTRGLHGITGQELKFAAHLPADQDTFVIGRIEPLAKLLPELHTPYTLTPDGYTISTVHHNGHNYIVIAGNDERGVLYGTFALLRSLALGQTYETDASYGPYSPMRWTNEWDNLDGTIERGYAGSSIFFENGHVAKDLTRAREYARLLASVGINGCVVDNVNADAKILTPEFLPELARLAEAFRPWGVKLGLSVKFDSPKSAGGLATFDPLDPQVAMWWRATADNLYKTIPDFGGFVIKADSEGQAGPASYGRTAADAANVIAAALEPHHGLVFYRGFVYNHHIDWRDLKIDRAKAAYDTFKPLDGKFAANALVQIKYGPMDFQVREPVSPLIGALEKTNLSLELQVTQEYTGQQRHLVYLAPMWKQIFDFNMHATKAGSTVAELVSGKTFNRPVGGFVAVVNVGRDANWLGSDLAQANLYAFGRLAWQPSLDPEAIAHEWSVQTFGGDPQVTETVVGMLMRSWPIYESYTGPLGVGTLTDISNNGGNHFGPNPDSTEGNGWGMWHRADAKGIGMDRTVATGTGFTAQYRPEVASLYEPLASCPDSLLLFMHHVPYTYVLHSGKTVAQHIYDSHYEGADAAAGLVTEWQTLRGKIDEDRYQSVLARLKFQRGHAILWRDVITEWLFDKSGIADTKGRVYHHSNRIEAESMTLDGYTVAVPEYPYAASGRKYVACTAASGHCAASFTVTAHEISPAIYHIAVVYYDLNNGVSRYKLLVDGKPVDEWQAALKLPTSIPDTHTAVRHESPAVVLKPGSVIRIEAQTDGDELAPLDYVEILDTPR